MSKRSSASRMHRNIAGWVEQSVEEITKSPWAYNINLEYTQDPFVVDVRVRWFHPRKKSHEVFIEIQKNKTEKKFLKKIETWKGEGRNYEIIWEDKISDSFKIGFKQVKEIIECTVPW